VPRTQVADGCVDLTSPENNGLQEIVDMLQPIADGVQGTLSRADVWALAASMAIEFAGGPSVQFQTGRLDATSCHGHGARLPDAELGRSHIIDIFVSKLGFTERETAALMGAHVLGRAVRSVSGYNGNWVPNKIVLITITSKICWPDHGIAILNNLSTGNRARSGMDPGQQ